MDTLPCQGPVVKCIYHNSVNDVVHPVSGKDKFAVGPQRAAYVPNPVRLI